jgi:hypothetical protein
MNHGYIEYEALLASASDRARKAAQQVAVTAMKREADGRFASTASDHRMAVLAKCEVLRNG